MFFFFFIKLLNRRSIPRKSCLVDRVFVSGHALLSSIKRKSARASIILNSELFQTMSRWDRSNGYADVKPTHTHVYVQRKPREIGGLYFNVIYKKRKGRNKREGK